LEPSIPSQGENLLAWTNDGEDVGIEPGEDENIVDGVARLPIQLTNSEIVVAQEEVPLGTFAENLSQLPAESTNFVQFLKEDWSNYRASATELEFSSQITRRTVLPSAGQKVFVTFTFVFSPKEFYFHLDGEVPACETLSTLLAEFYERATGPQGAIASIDPSTVEVGHAYMVRDAKAAHQWCRAVVDEKGSEDCHLQLIDWGTNQFTMYPQIFPLISFAARWPPFAIHAKLHDLETRELTQKAVQRFRGEIQSSNDRALVEFSQGPAFTDPAEVQLCSMTGQNVGYSYSAAAFREQKMQRAYQSAASRSSAKQNRTDRSVSNSKLDDECDDQKAEGTSLAFSMPAGISRHSTGTTNKSSNSVTISAAAAAVQNLQPKSAVDEEQQLQRALKLSMQDQ